MSVYSKKLQLKKIKGNINRILSYYKKEENKEKKKKERKKQKKQI